MDGSISTNLLLNTIPKQSPKMSQRLPTRFSNSKIRASRPASAFDYLAEHISKFWHKPRIDAPIPHILKPQVPCHMELNHTASPDYSCNMSGCPFQKSISKGEILCVLLMSAGAVYIMGICGQKYRLLRMAKRDWDAQSQRGRIGSKTETNRRDIRVSSIKGLENHNTENSEIVGLTKWAWILHRADELERGRKGRHENGGLNAK